MGMTRLFAGVTTVVLCAALFGMCGCASDSVQSEKIDCFKEDGRPELNTLIGLVGNEYDNVLVPSDYDLFESDQKNELYPEDMLENASNPDYSPEYFTFFFDDEAMKMSEKKLVNLITVYWIDGFDPDEIMADQFSSLDLNVEDSYFYRNPEDPSDFELGVFGTNETEDEVFVKITPASGWVSTDDFDDFGLASSQFSSAKRSAGDMVLPDGTTALKPGFVSPAC